MTAAPASQRSIVRLALTLYRAFLDALPYPAWVKDADGRYVAVNSAFRKFCEVHLGRVGIEIIGAADASKLLTREQLEPWIWVERIPHHGQAPGVAPHSTYVV